MMDNLKIQLRLLILFFLCACGFTPALVNDSSLLAELKNIELAEPVNEVDYLFVRAFDLRTVPRRNFPENTLRYQISISETSTGLGRIQLLGKIEYEVWSDADQRITQRGDASSFVGFSNPLTAFETSIQRRNAKERLLTILADRVYYQLIQKFS